MKKFNYKVAAAFSSFVLAGASLIASTVAWFAVANDLRVNNLTYSIYDDKGILEFGLKTDRYDVIAPSLTEDDGEWDENNEIFFFCRAITQEDLEMFGQYDTAMKIKPCSAAYSENWFDENTEEYESSYPQFVKMPNSANILGNKVIEPTETKEYYYQFEIYVRAVSVSVFVFLSTGTTVTANTAANEEAAKESKYTVDDLNGVKNYVRMSVYSHLDYTKTSEIDGVSTINKSKYYIYDPQADTDYVPTSYFGRLDIDPQDGYYDIDQANASGETKANELLYGHYENADKITYDESARAEGVVSSKASGGFFANSWWNSNPVNISKSVENGLTGYKENALTQNTIRSTTTYKYKVFENALCYASHSNPQRIVVSVWAEGWDTNCNNASQNSSFNVNIRLNGRDEKNLEKLD